MSDQLFRQHQHLAHIISAVEHSVAFSSGTRTVGMLLEHLVDYLNNHFAAEEKCMAEMEFPGLAEHRRQHEACGAGLLALLADIERGGASVPDVLDFLRPWFANHEHDADSQYAAFMAEHQKTVGPQPSAGAPRLTDDIV